MAMIACPGCGLPREEELIGVVACPVCATDLAPGAASAPPRRAQPTAPDPTAGLPSDVSQLHSQSATRDPILTPVRAVGVFAFVVGAACGVAGVLLWQHATAPTPAVEQPVITLASLSHPPSTTVNVPPGRPAEVAPMPHAPTAKSESPKPLAPIAKFDPPPPAGRITVVNINEPNGIYSPPFPLRNGEHIVLRGKVRLLQLDSGLESGAVLDATGLEVATVAIGGRIDGKSQLKLNVPNGIVQITAAVTGRSIVEVNAPGGDVRFQSPTLPGNDGSKIDGGAAVTLTGRSVVLNGDVNGVETRVLVHLPVGGLLKVAAVRGTATVEYKVAPGKGAPPNVTAGTVAPSAVFRKID